MPFELTQLTQIHEVVTAHSQSHGHLPQARLGLPSCQGGAGRPEPGARSRGRSMAGHIEHPTCHRGTARGDRQPTSVGSSQVPIPCLNGVNTQKSRISMPSVASLSDKLLQLDLGAQASVSRGARHLKRAVWHMVMCWRGSPSQLHPKAHSPLLPCLLCRVSPRPCTVCGCFGWITCPWHLPYVYSKPQLPLSRSAEISFRESEFLLGVYA